MYHANHNPIHSSIGGNEMTSSPTRPLHSHRQPQNVRPPLIPTNLNTPPTSPDIQSPTGSFPSSSAVRPSSSREHRSIGGGSSLAVTGEKTHRAVGLTNGR